VGGQGGRRGRKRRQHSASCIGGASGSKPRASRPAELGPTALALTVGGHLPPQRQEAAAEGQGHGGARGLRAGQVHGRQHSRVKPYGHGVGGRRRLPALAAALLGGRGRRCGGLALRAGGTFHRRGLWVGGLAGGAAPRLLRLLLLLRAGMLCSCPPLLRRPLLLLRLFLLLLLLLLRLFLFRLLLLHLLTALPAHGCFPGGTLRALPLCGTPPRRFR
jgi:hypothetical protein